MREQGLKLLRTALANPAADFRAGQWDCIDGILRSQRQLVVQKTGWGKSMVYFLGTRLLRDQGHLRSLLSERIGHRRGDYGRAGAGAVAVGRCRLGTHGPGG